MPEKVKASKNKNRSFGAKIKSALKRPDIDITIVVAVLTLAMITYNYLTSPRIELTSVETSAQQTVVSTRNIGTTVPIDAMININAANAKALMVLPGMTQKIADAVVKHRGEIGYYVSVDQLLDVTGMTKTLYNKISPYIKLTEEN